jgi:glutamyl-tRNA synthetase
LLDSDLAECGDDSWIAEILETRLRDFAERQGVKLGAVAQPLRAALTGSLASPGIFEVMQVLGRVESLARINDAASGA